MSYELVYTSIHSSINKRVNRLQAGGRAALPADGLRAGRCRPSRAAATDAGVLRRAQGDVDAHPADRLVDDGYPYGHPGPTGPHGADRPSPSHRRRRRGAAQPGRTHDDVQRIHAGG